MSDLLETAAAALGIPSALAQRSAAARATADGTTADQVLAAWGGDAPTPAATATPTPPPTGSTAPVPEPAPSAVAVIEAPVAPPPPQMIQQVVYATEPAEPLEPVSLGRRVATAVRVGAWTGAVLGLVGFFVASAFWADSAAVLPDTGPVAQVDATSTVIGVALVSTLFGAIVAGFSRAAASWANPAMQLSGSKAATVWVGAGLGLVLGLGGGALLTSGFGTEVESGEGVVQLPVLATLALVLLGSSLLGAVTSGVPQLFGTPVAVDESDRDEMAEVRGRLGNAVTIPIAGALILAVLVLPFAYILIQSNHLTSGGAAIIAILAAAGILGFAALAGGQPQMRISFGDLLWALAGIGTVLVIVLAVLVFNSDEGQESGGDHQAAAIVQILGDLT